MNSSHYWIAGGILLVIIAGWYVWGGTSDEQGHIFAEVHRGPFEISVQTTGELRAKESEEINAPSGLRSAGIYRVEISDLVSEGTVVSKGEYIATLDRSELSGKIQDRNSELEQLRSQLRQTQLDTMLEMRGLRNELIDLRHNLEEHEIEVEQSQFEPPATQRQARINLERAERNLRQTKENYEIRQEQAEAKVQEVTANLSQLQREKDELEEMLEQFEITAPSSGMVIYRRNRDGERRDVGSTVTPWNPVVATLPDLDTMISRTYVNEIDISKVDLGQPVEVGIDAFPGKKLKGEVISVANVGEELRRADARVFEVEVLITERDTSLRPAMTSSNKIITDHYDDELNIPLEGLHQNDTMEYVIRRDGQSRFLQQIETAASNDDRVIVKKGLDAGDEIYLTLPDNHEDFPARPYE